MRKFIVMLFVLGLFGSVTVFFKPVFGAFDCLLLTPSSPPDQKSFCQNELNQIEQQLADLQVKQKDQARQTGTLKGDVAYLSSQIATLKTKIKARELVIAKLKVDISEKSSVIESLSEKIEREKESLGQLLRKDNEMDDSNIVHIMLSADSLSAFYADVDDFTSLKKSISTSVDKIRGVKTVTEIEKVSLEQKQNQEVDAKVELDQSRQKVAVKEKDQKQLLSISQQKESDYQKLAAGKKARADKIRSALFSLRDSKAIPFGTALSYAQIAEKITGVRPAMVLAILTQESNLGSNVGTCNRATDTPSKSWENIMNPRDIPAFKRITASLGMNPFGTPLSCPQSFGYGGAMGPSQFIPSTWESYIDKITNALGLSGAPNPWEPLHAITATSLLIKDNQNGGTGYTAERNAACRYYSGSACPAKGTTTMKRAVIGYGNNVMSLAKKIQADIDILQGN